MTDAIGIIIVLIIFSVVFVWVFRGGIPNKDVSRISTGQKDSAKPLFKIISIGLAAIFGFFAPLAFFGGPDAKFGAGSMIAGITYIGISLLFIILAKRLS